MKTNDMNNNPVDIRELNDAELENINGGGIREIVAATTLATMVATGMTGAFGLAKASAEPFSEAVEAPVDEVTFVLGEDDPMELPVEETIDTVEGLPMEADAAYFAEGDLVIVDTGTASNAGVWKNWDDITSRKANYSLPNGTVVTLLGESRYNGSKKRNYVRIGFTHKGKSCKGWIASSIVGLKR